VALCVAVSAAAVLLERIEAAVLGGTWLEALVLAILIGTALRTFWTPGPRWRSGIALSARTLLEIAVVLLGASVSAATVLAAGWKLLAGIAAVVALALAASYGIGRLLGLPARMATLVACGNSICGNSAIAAVAPVIGADGEDIAASIAFTAVLGVAVVLAMPLVATGLHLGAFQAGVMAGLTVYAVPQVLAATAPLGTVALQMGTLVKLVRVLMLGPVVLALSLLRRRGAALSRAGLQRLVPWFILGFLALAGLRSAALLPHALLGPAAAAANLLTIVSMAALGLGTDLKLVARAGGRVTAAVIASLLALGGMSLALVSALGIGG
jgi:uncharacterized integral membrane protein (TIGR00698 family)